jgi:hypothetical protein
MKKILILAFAVMILSALCSCNNTQNDISYLDKAQALVGDSVTLAKNQEFVNLYTVSGEMYDTAKAFSKIDAVSPKAVYKLTVDKQKLQKEFDQSGKKDKFSTLYSLNKFPLISFATSYNASFSSNTVSTCAIFTQQKGYIKPADFDKDFALYLEYDGEYSAFVSFSENGQGVIQADMTFIKQNQNGIEGFKSFIADILGENFTFDPLQSK